MTTMNGAAMAVFSVRLSEASINEIRVGWQTEDGTGHAGTDYKAATGTLIFPAGTLEQTLQVEVYGRSPTDSTEDRTFLIRLNPPVDAMLENATAECVISVVAQDGNVFTQVYIPAGPRGRPGNPGDIGLNTFELAKLNGFGGTLTQWLATVTGRNVELINDGTWIKWRPQDTENPQPWQNLIELATLQGEPGDDGREVQMQKSATAIQWRYTGVTAWTDLVQLADLKADPQPLVNRGNWATATTYNPGDYVAATSTASTAKSLYFLLDAVPYVSNSEPKDDLTHWVELQPPQGVKGDDGREVEFQVSATAIQWRYEGDAAWADLILLSELKGENGNNIELQKTATYLQWRVVGAASWQNLVALADITGANGQNIELQKGATFIQWRVVGTATWLDLIAIADITGAAGAKWLTGTTVPAAGTGANGDCYLRTPVGEIYQKAAGAWALLMTISGGTSSGIQWFSGTSAPSNGTGKDGDLHLHETTGQIRKRVSGVWTNLILIPLLATSAQAKDALLSTVAATPAGVREFMEQYGFTSSYTTDATDLNTLTGETDRTVVFGFNASTLNIPFSGAYGRGIMFAGGGNYSTQVVWINGTNDQYVRNHNGTTWDASWKKQAFNENDLISTPWTTVTLQNGWTIAAGRRAAFRKVLGMVYLEINVTGGTFTTGTAIFTLPPGFIPPFLPLFPCFASGNASRVGTMYINSSGQVCIERAPTATGEIGFQISFAVQ